VEYLSATQLYISTDYWGAGILSVAPTLRAPSAGLKAIATSETTAMPKYQYTRNYDIDTSTGRHYSDGVAVVPFRGCRVGRAAGQSDLDVWKTEYPQEIGGLNMSDS